MRCTDTRQELGPKHGEKTIGRIGAAALASQSHAVGGKDACTNGKRRGCGAADRVQVVEGGAL